MNNIGFYAIVVNVMGFRDLFFYRQELMRLYLGQNIKKAILTCV